MFVGEGKGLKTKKLSEEGAYTLTNRENDGGRGGAESTAWKLHARAGAHKLLKQFSQRFCLVKQSIVCRCMQIFVHVNRSAYHFVVICQVRGCTNENSCRYLSIVDLTFLLQCGDGAYRFFAGQAAVHKSDSSLLRWYADRILSWILGILDNEMLHIRRG